MNFKLFKLGAAAALTVSGANMISTLKPVAATTYKSAVKRVKINYLPGKGVRIWTNYHNGSFMGFRAKDGTEWNVVKTAVDKNGNLWYMVGDQEWIEARYTVDVEENNEDLKSKTKKAKSLLAKAKEAVTKTTKVTAKQKRAEKAQAAKEQALAKKSAKKEAAPTMKQLSSVAQAPNVVNAIIALAKEQVGKPYAWGANGPDIFDCSSLVQYVYAKAAGFNLPRTTYDQVKVGETVSLDALEPGDLIFWGSATAPYHVALYIGNNQYVNAATPEQGVVLQTLTSYYYPTIAKRILNVNN